MCYTGGPRCSSYAAKKLADTWLELQSAFFNSRTDRDMDQIEKIVAQRVKWEKEYSITPAGIAELQLRADSDEGFGRVRSKRLLEEAKALRAKKLAKNSHKDEGDVGKHRKPPTKVPHDGIFLTDFDPTNTPRTGFSAFPSDEEESKLIRKHATFLNSMSHQWVNQLSPRQIALLTWWTDSGSRVFSEHHYGDDPEALKKITSFTPEQMDEAQKELDDAFSKSPKLEESVVLYRGIGNAAHFNLKEVIRTGYYEPTSVMSATTNVGVVNAFAKELSNAGLPPSMNYPVHSDKFPDEYVDDPENIHMMLEIKTKTIACPSQVSSQANKEFETLLPPGRYRLVNVMKNVQCGWTKEHTRPFIVVQLEEC